MTSEARDDFARLVLYDMQPAQKVLELADLFAHRMIELNGGTLWMGAHMRRGDCKSLSRVQIVHP
jgi:hypothetical protein